MASTRVCCLRKQRIVVRVLGQAAQVEPRSRVGSAKQLDVAQEALDLHLNIADELVRRGQHRPVVRRHWAEEEVDQRRCLGSRTGPVEVNLPSRCCHAAKANGDLPFAPNLLELHARGCNCVENTSGRVDSQRGLRAFLAWSQLYLPPMGKVSKLRLDVGIFLAGAFSLPFFAIFV
ncbi:hypothetical protein PHYSODRAFT_304393 [Phytophthora sojae]|uniref:Uncharacterized protein n=1 Tax=Phytophthora sojae (strain P6497) TaxID=1094619 RepID=G5A0K9_PHYSP|nr:hypothetical protein PHYSODRAFT_304393 [Phytophthora sojae]EGZ10545.1 hypothetical protein PHYSODRAFT_304393 [Phytophthora sojae]|eukprot:XP_009533290.1 hypothetical protein PHYSODRAFT_304393 [Phytophthora sojae]